MADVRVARDLSLRKAVFLPPWILMVGMVVVSLVNGDAFLAGLNAVTGWILNNFAWAFNLRFGAGACSGAKGYAI